MNEPPQPYDGPWCEPTMCEFPDLREISMSLERCLEWASNRIERVGYGEVSPTQLERIVAILIKNLWFLYCNQSPIRPQIHPTLAVCECLLSDRSIRIVLKARIYLRLAVWFFQRVAKKYGDIPGVNDGLMVRWLWTHDRQYVTQLIERSRRLNEIGSSCRWMLDYQRLRHPPLDEALKENGYGP